MNKPSKNPGALYIVATPIGNKEDITLRALRILKSVDLILAEDTRHSLPLLMSLGINTHLSSLHDHNELHKSKYVIDQILEGKSIALISDAGTPLISDPGYPLVKLAREHNISVSPIPGPCAITAALSAAGIPCDAFLFLGFLPARQQARINKLKSLNTQPHTLIFYESTHRIKESIEDIGTVYGEECKILLAKELTKSFEQFVSGTVLELKNWLEFDSNRLKGEFVLMIPAGSITTHQNDHESTLALLLEELPLKQAVALACKLTNANKNELYEKALELKSKGTNS